VSFLFNPSVTSNITNLSVDSIAVTSDKVSKSKLPDAAELPVDRPPMSIFHSLPSNTNEAMVSLVLKDLPDKPLMVLPLPLR
jgi:hypothetical protein